MHHCNPHRTASETVRPRLSIRSLRACVATTVSRKKSLALWPGSRGAVPMAAKHRLARPGASGDRKLDSVLPVDPGFLVPQEREPARLQGLPQFTPRQARVRVL